MSEKNKSLSIKINIEISYGEHDSDESQKELLKEIETIMKMCVSEKIKELVANKR